MGKGAVAVKSDGDEAPTGWRSRAGQSVFTNVKKMTSPNAPEGFKTVPGWWVAKESEAIDMLRNPVATFLADADRLEAICKAEDLPIKHVEAPEVLRKFAGRTVARAYPVTLLEEFYPSEP